MIKHTQTIRHQMYMLLRNYNATTTNGLSFAKKSGQKGKNQQNDHNQRNDHILKEIRNQASE